MSPNPMQFDVVRQLIGAATGVAIAAVIYFGYQQVSDLSLSALLVSPNTVSENAGEIRINEKNVDDATLRLIARRAQTVAAQLAQDQKQSSSPNAAAVALQQSAAENLDRRTRLAQIRALAANASTYSTPNPTQDVSQRERIDARNQNVIETDSSHAAAGSLPNSGLALNVVMFISFVAALCAVPDVRRKLIAATR